MRHLGRCVVLCATIPFQPIPSMIKGVREESNQWQIDEAINPCTCIMFMLASKGFEFKMSVVPASRGWFGTAMGSQQSGSEDMHECPSH